MARSNFGVVARAALLLSLTDNYISTFRFRFTVDVPHNRHSESKNINIPHTSEGMNGYCVGASEHCSVQLLSYQ
jgi:hypothetical protein